MLRRRLFRFAGILTSISSPSGRVRGRLNDAAGFIGKPEHVFHQLVLQRCQQGSEPPQHSLILAPDVD